MNMLNFKNRLLLVALLLLGSITVTYTANAMTTTSFANYIWKVKDGVGGPGATGVGNNWSASTEDVFVDGSDLHLNVSQHDGKWYSSEVSLLESLGYGKYTFDIDPTLNSLDKNLVAAPFLYQQDDAHEIDIEHSYWANTSTDTNLYYTVQPYNKPGNQQTQSLAWPNTAFQDIIYWEPNKITLSTEQNGNQLSSWVYSSSTDGTSNNFTPGNERVHINFWQYQSLVPLDVSSTHEFIINNFTFEPLATSSAPNDTTTSTPTSTPPSDTTTTSTSSTIAVNLNIRYNNILIFSGSVNLATSTTITDDQRNSTTTTSTTALTALINAENQTDTFSIYDLQPFYNGYYVKCLYLSINSTSTCDNWNYVVDNKYPSVGMDSYPLKGGENIYIYFGDRYNLTTEKTTFSTNETITSTLKEYSYQTNDWTMSNDQLILATEPILSDYSNWPPTKITETTTTNGLALFTFNTTGTYFITLPDSYWLGILINVTSTVATTTNNTSTSTNSSGNSGGSSNTATNQLISAEKINDAVSKILNFLKSKQDADGMISDANTSDWAAMALGSKKIYASDVKNGGKSLYNFIYNINIEDIEKENNKCTGYARHILALLSAGTGKTDTKIIELKNKLDTVCVRNNTFGLSGINDDVFGLIAALALDENQTSPTVSVPLSTIKADQQVDGSFTWSGTSGADVTGAAINALQYAKTKGATVDNDIFTKAKNYLEKQQLPDGGWCYDIAWCNNISDSNTTGWVMMGLNALGQTQNDWFNSAGENPWNILTTLNNDHFTQSWNGDVDWFGTKHAVPALLGLSWPITLDPKPITVASTPTSGGGSTTPTTTSTIATTTIATASTTPIIATTIIATTPTSTMLVTPKIITTNIVASQNSSSQIKPENKVTKTILKDEKKEIVIKTQQELTAGQPPVDQNKIIDNLPLDTPTKRTAKKVLAVSGGSALLVAGYLGLRLLRNVV